MNRILPFVMVTCLTLAPVSVAQQTSSESQPSAKSKTVSHGDIVSTSTTQEKSTAPSQNGSAKKSSTKSGAHKRTRKSKSAAGASSNTQSARTPH